MGLPEVRHALWSEYARMLALCRTACSHFNRAAESMNEWKPFPPPGPGLYDIRDRTGVLMERVEIDRHANGKLKCLGMDAERTMVPPHCSLDYEWRLTQTVTVKHD